MSDNKSLPVESGWIGLTEEEATQKEEEKKRKLIEMYKYGMPKMSSLESYIREHYGNHQNGIVTEASVVGHDTLSDDQ